jgi:glycerol-3-phosphate dehydrogenase (NAD(P)+)
VPRRSRPQLYLPTPGVRRAVVVGAGSFGTAVAVLLARGVTRTTLQARTEDQARRLAADRENQAYLPGVELPGELRVETVAAGLSRAGHCPPWDRHRTLTVESKYFLYYLMDLGNA